MYLLLWILSFPSILYHIFFTIILVVIFLYHKISHHLFKTANSTASVNHYQQYIKEKQNSLFRMYNHKFNKPSTNSSNVTSNSIKSNTLVILALVLICQNDIGSVQCLEADAILLKPFADVAKSIISALTTGAPTGVEIRSTELAKSFLSFSWRTGFPVYMPTGFIDHGTEFYNRIMQRVNEADVSELQRKRLITLKVDLDNIVDSLVEHVRKSPEGLYANWLEADVNGVPLEDACYNVGLQFKAYGIDISNYRQLAGQVLGLPVVPTVAKHVVNAGKAAAPITQLPGAAFNSMTQMSGSAFNSLSNNIPFSIPLASNYFSDPNNQLSDSSPTDSPQLIQVV